MTQYWSGPGTDFRVGDVALSNSMVVVVTRAAETLGGGQFLYLDLVGSLSVPDDIEVLRLYDAYEQGK